MQNRKHTAWKKNRKLTNVHGGRMSPKITDNIFNRMHSLRRPGPGETTPIVIEDNPSRDYYFPADGAQCLAALRKLPRKDVDELTHLWLRRPGIAHRRIGSPLATFICGSGVRVIVMYPWRVDGRLCVGRARPTPGVRRDYERFGAVIETHRGWWYICFEREPLRDFFLHVLFHEVGHHVDWYRRHWSKANVKGTEEAAEQYALRHSRGLP